MKAVNFNGHVHIEHIFSQFEIKDIFVLGKRNLRGFVNGKQNFSEIR